jgi:GMP synthase-like glutamine amidotransferase
MRIAILEPGAPPKDLIGRFGSYGDMVAAMLGGGFETQAFDVRRGIYPPTDGFDGYVITGSAAGVYDPDPWIPALKDWIQRTAGAAPMIGICFGHQLMAEAFGGRAEKSAKGWGVGLDTYTLNTTAPWMDRDAASMTLPVSHQDQVTAVGPGAAVLGGSDFCPFGLIAYPDRKALSLQPHPEFDPAYAAALITTRRDGPLTPAHADRAIASLKAPNDNAKVAGWLRRFLREG